MKLKILQFSVTLSFLFLSGLVSVYAQTRFWIGNSGDWNDATHWSATSGGAGGASVPTTTNDVVFDANSFTLSNRVVTVTTGAACNSMNWTGVTNTPRLNLANSLSIAGTTVTFVNGMTISGTSALNFSNSGTITVNMGTASKTLGDLNFGSPTAVILNTGNGGHSHTFGVISTNECFFTVNGNSTKIYGGLTFTGSTANTFNGTATFNGPVSFGLATYINSGTPWSNNTFNSTVTIASMATSADANFSNCTFNGNLTFVSGGDSYFNNCTFGAGDNLIAQNSSNVFIQNGNSFSSTSTIDINRSVTVSGTGNTFNNAWILRDNSTNQFQRGYTYGGTFTIGNTTTTTFSGPGANTFSSSLTAGTGNTISFTNTSANNFQAVTIGSGTNWNFSTSGTSTVAGNFFVNTASCSSPAANINSSGAPGQATVNFSTFSNPVNVNISNINNTGTTINVLVGTGSNNTNINYPASSARTLYWVGNSGNWNSFTNWSLSSGGPANACPPTSIDNVIFDANSFTAAGHTVTVTAGAACNDMTWAAATNNPTFQLSNDLTIEGTSWILANTMTVSGTGQVVFNNTGNLNLNLNNGAKTITGGFRFTATTARTITLGTSNAVVTHVIGALIVGNNSTIDVNGTSTKTYTTTTLGTGVSGTFNGTNNFTNITVNGTAGGGLTFNTATFTGTTNLTGRYTFTGTTNFTGATGTLTGTSTNSFASTNFTNANITFAGSHSNTFTGTTNFTGATVSIGNTGNNTFATVVATGGTVTLRNIGSNTITNLTLNPSATNDLFWSFTKDGTNSITTSFASNTGCKYVYISSSVTGIQAPLSLGGVAHIINGPAIQDINRTGALLTVNNGINLGNNTGITFLFTALPARILYWVGGAAGATTSNWSDPTNWSATSGGAGGQCPPTINDDVNFNGASFTATKNTVTIDVDAACRTMNWTGATNTPLLTGSAARSLTISGNLTLAGTMQQTGISPGSTFLGTVNFFTGATGRTVNMGSASNAFANVNFQGIGGGWTIQSNTFTVVNTLSLISGSLDAGTRAIVAGTLTVNDPSDLTRSLNLGSSGSHQITGSGLALDLRGNSSNFTLNSGTSTITFTNSGNVRIRPGAATKTLPNLSFPSASSVDIEAADSPQRITFGTITTGNVAGRTMTIQGNCPKTYGAITINGDNTTTEFYGSADPAPDNNQFAAVTFTNGRTGTTALFDGTNVFSGAVNIHSTSGSADYVEFYGDNTFNSTFTARLNGTASTELQFASISGNTAFNDAVSINPGDATGVAAVFNNATTFGVGDNLTVGDNTTLLFQGSGANTFRNVTIGNNSTTTFSGSGANTFGTVTIGNASTNTFNRTGGNTFTGDFTIGNSSTTLFQSSGNHTFTNVIVNHSSSFTLNSIGNSNFTSATINSATGTGVTWAFRHGRQATFTGNMNITANCNAPVYVQSTQTGTRANVSLPAVQTFNNNVIVQDINANGSAINTFTVAANVPGAPNNVNVTYNSGNNANRTLYWVGNSGNWNDANEWSTSSGGAGGACAPTASDDVVFDNNSYSTTGFTTTVNINPAACRNMTWTSGVTADTPTFAMSNNTLEINGNLTLAPGMSITGTSTTNSLMHFTTNGAANTSNTRTITIPAGTTASIPVARFTDVNVTWNLSGAGTFSVTNELGLAAGTLNTNSLTMNLGILNANRTVAAVYINRTLNIQNSAISLNSANTTVLDFRGSNFTFAIPGATSSINAANTGGVYQQLYFGQGTGAGYLGVNPGSPRTTALLREIPNLILSCRDVDIFTADYNVTDGVANRTIFRNVTNVNGGQFYFAGTSPHTYGAITVAANLNTAGNDQRRIVGSSNVAPNHNIFTGAVSFGANSGFLFEGVNEFQSTFTVSGGSIDGDDAFLFYRSNTFQGAVDITGTNGIRVNPTIHFGSFGGATSNTAFNNNVTFRGSTVYYRFSGPATLAASSTMTFDDETIGWFVGGNGVMAGPESTPAPAGTSLYTLSGNLILNKQTRVRFVNTTTSVNKNVLNNITMGDYSTLEFSSINNGTNQTDVTGTLTASGDCAAWRKITSCSVGTIARVAFTHPTINQNWNYTLIREINNLGPRTVTAANSTDIGGASTGINFTGFVATARTLYWVGGHSQNQSTDNYWNNPGNWAVNPNDANQRRFGVTCPPDELTTVVFDNRSFSSAATSPKTDANGQTHTRDMVRLDKVGSRCYDMIWEPNIQDGAILDGVLTNSTGLITDPNGDDANMTLYIYGNLQFDKKMTNNYNGQVSFVPTNTTPHTIDLNGVSGGSPNLRAFAGPVNINSPYADYTLTTDLLINSATRSIADESLGLTIYSGTLRGNGKNIELNGNWTILGTGRYIHGGAGTVTFNGASNISDVTSDVQNIVAGINNPFYNLAINRASNTAVPTDVTNGGVTVNQGSWVTIRNRNYQVGATIYPEPANAANRYSPDNGITVANNLSITSGGLYDGGYQIVGNATGTLSLAAGTVLSIGTANAYSGSSNNSPLTTVFPINYPIGNISLATTSTVSYSSHGHQDIKGGITYGHLYFRNANCSFDGTLYNGASALYGSLNNGCQRKRLAMGLITLAGNLTLESGILFADNGFQVTVAPTSQLTMNNNSSLVLGSATQNIAATRGDGVTAPLFNGTNTTGTLATTASATTFPFTNAANINLAANSSVVYYSTLPQTIKGLNSATSSQQYGHLVLLNPTAGATSIVPKTLDAATTVRSALVIYPNNNLVDNGFQITGTANQAFRMDASESIQDLTQSSQIGTRAVSGLAQMVVGNATTATVFPLNYLDSDLNLDAGTTIVYNAGLAQVVRGMSSATASQQYANLTLTNPVSVAPVVAGKTLTAPTTVRETLIINPNNNFIDNGNQITGVAGQTFYMFRSTLATNPVSNSGTVGTTGESRLTLGNATTATFFPLGYFTTSSNINFEPNTTVVYNAGVAQQIRGLSSGSPNSNYANLMLTNPATALSGSAVFPVIKTLEFSIPIRGNLTINPNNTFADGGNVVAGTAGQRFSMFNATLPTDPGTGATIGIAGESRYVIGSDGSAQAFPSGFRTGDGSGGDPSDINFEAHTTIVYNSLNDQNITGLGGTGTTTYANLTLTNPNTSSSLVTKSIQNRATRIRNTLTINPNNQLYDNGFQLSGTAGGRLNMYNATLATNPLRANTGQSATTGTTGASYLTLGTAAAATTFPTGLNTVGTAGTPSDINFELNTWVIYFSGVNQNVQGIIDNVSAASNGNYAQVSFINQGGVLRTKTLTGNMRVRQNLTIGGLTSGAASGTNSRLDVSNSNYKIFLQGNWYTHPNNSFNARSGEVELEGSTTQTITTRPTQSYTSEAGTQDFNNLTVNNTTVAPTAAVQLGSNVGVTGIMNFQRGLVQSATLATHTTSPTNQLLIFRNNATATNASDNSFVLGAVRKVGGLTPPTGTFLFPIGDVLNGTTPFYRPSGISGTASSSTSFISQYNYVNPVFGGYDPKTKQSSTICSSGPLVSVSARELWFVNRETGSDNVFVTLTWREPQSGGVGTNSVATNYQGLRVARWNGSMWQNLGGAGTHASYMGSLSNTNGAVTSTYNTSGCAGAVNNFSPFTLSSEIDFNPLPVTLIDFRAEAANQQVNLNWQTSTEIHTSHYVVERSKDGQTFERVTEVAAKGNSNSLQAYKALDTKPFAGVSYYRLKIVDTDGSVTYSKLVKVVLGIAGGLGEVVVYPNPSEGKSISVKLADADAKVLAVHDLLGRQVGYRMATNDDGSLRIEFAEMLAKGTYVALITSADGKQTARIKFVVQ